MSNWKKIKAEEMPGNIFEMIGNQWMLISAGNPENMNTMTASWGGMGIMWHKPVAWCVVRPNRHTYIFMENSDRFSLCFFPEEYRDALNYCGTHSGRDVDKIKESGLTVAFSDEGVPVFEEAELAIVCRKIYFQNINPDHFLDPSIESKYPEKQYHRMYIAEIESVLQKQ